ncbi:MAG: glycosyltransferase [Planctomycetes bacterium]|nr:glycosyltransferase [Planctomycetota bacterium]
MATGRMAESVRHCLEATRVSFFPERGAGFPSELWYDETVAKRTLLRPLRKLWPGLFPYPNASDFAAKRLRQALRHWKPDVVSVHNLHAAAPWGWDIHLIAVCLEFAPVVWTLHDMWSFTGRCAYSYDCEKFITGCDVSCPTPDEAPALAPERIQSAWEQRRSLYARHVEDLVIVTPSRWLASQARRGMLARHRIEVIPYGLDTSLFAPGLREDARRQLRIKPAGPVLLVAAADLTERRKGAAILPALWKQIEPRSLTILTMGRGAITIDDPLIEVHALGYLNDDLAKTLAYRAADLLLHPAPVDNFPNVVLEAMACGTPTVALPVGGVPEMVRAGLTGWLANQATPAALGRAVEGALRDLANGRTLRESCRKLAETEYSLELQGRRYFELFQQLRKARGSGRINWHE